MQPDQEMIARWSGSAQYWEKHRDMIRHMFAPVTQALAEHARVCVGHAVLDVATGPGEPALRIAEMVGPDGRVIGVDLAAEMVEAACRAAERMGIANARFEAASADDLPFANDTFDAVVSRFGVMFFPSPVDGVREMLRVLKPGGRLALAVWHHADRNPFLNGVSRVIERYVPTEPLAPDAPDTFRFAESGKLRDILSRAGVTAPTEHVVRFEIQVPLSLEECWTMRCEMSEKLREKLASLSAGQSTDVKRESLDALRPYATAQGMSFPSEVLVVTGSKRS